MRSLKKLFAMPIAMACSALCLVSSSVNAHEQEFEEPCESGVICRVTTREPYVTLYNTLSPATDSLSALLDLFVLAPSTTTYNSLYNAALSLATSSGNRVIITLSDGRVVVDTAVAADLACATPMVPANGFCHFTSILGIGSTFSLGTNLAALNANIWRCGVGAATQVVDVTTAPFTSQAFVAIRLGHYLQNAGVAIIASTLLLM